MIGAPNSLNLNCKVRVMKEAPGPSVSEEIADIFTNYNIDTLFFMLDTFCCRTHPLQHKFMGLPHVLTFLEFVLENTCMLRKCS